MGRRVSVIWAEMLCAYLDAQPQSVWVLADLLTEADAEPLRPGSDDKRVRRVLGLLPPLLAHTVACDFADHVLEPEARGVVTMKRRWLAGEVDDRTLARAPYPRDHNLEELMLLERVKVTSPTPSVSPAVAKSAVRAVGSQRRQNQEVAWQLGHLKHVLRGFVSPTVGGQSTATSSRS